MKRKIKNRIFLLVVFGSILFSGFIFSVINSFHKDTMNSQNYIKPSDSGSIVLDYNYYFKVDGRCSYKVIWSFTSSNSYVGIDVIAMDYWDYYYFSRDLSFSYHVLSVGIFISDSGEFLVPYEDTWYILFINVDSSMQSTTLTYSVEFDNFNPIILIPIILGIVAVIGVIVGIVYYNKKKKARAIAPQSYTYQQPYQQEYKQSYQQVYQPSSPQQITPIKEQAPIETPTIKRFCSYCGEKIAVTDSNFCQNCGAKLKE